MQTLLDYIGDGDTLDSFLRDFTTVKREQAIAFLELAKDQLIECVFLDECVNPRVRQAFTHHEVLTVAESLWRTLPDEQLTARIQGRFDILVTIDKGFEFETNLKDLAFGIVIVDVKRNRIEHYRPIFRALVEAVERVKAGDPRVGRAGIGSPGLVRALFRDGESGLGGHVGVPVIFERLQ